MTAQRWERLRSAPSTELGVVRGAKRVLLAGDAAGDAASLLRGLPSSAFETVVVADAEAFLKALRDFTPDIVLVDDGLARLSCERALQAVRAIDEFVPVILVAGPLDEARLVALLGDGLTEFVPKDSLFMLRPMVSVAMSRAHAQRRGAEAGAGIDTVGGRLRAVVESSGEAIVVFDSDRRIVFWSTLAARVFGYSEGEVLGTSVLRLTPDRPEVLTWTPTADVDAIDAVTYRLKGLRSDGSVFPAQVTMSAWREERWHFCVQIRDLTTQLAEDRERTILNRVVDQATNLVIITDLTGAMTYVNPAFERITGFTADEAVGNNPRMLKSDRLSPEAYGDLWRELLSGRPFKGDFTNRRKDGTEYRQRTTLFPVLGDDGLVEAYVAIGQDVTHEELLERQFREAQKMAAVGQLAGGVAHDFNNLLQGILANAQLLEMDLGDDVVDAHESVEEILAAAVRGSDLVKGLLSVARSETPQTEALDVRDPISDSIKMIRRTAPANIEVQAAMPKHPVLCAVDGGQLQQALLNLANNARDAMPEGGRLSIDVIVDADDGLPGAVTVLVTDTGVGMPPEVLDRVFEPFYTTKGVGKGTGLGLAMVFGFARGAGGNASADSMVGQGATFTLTLPLVNHARSS